MRAASGAYAGGPDTYASLIDFAAADARRLTSRERDLGLVWRDGERLFRAAVVEDTRELYVVQLGPAGEGGGHVEVLGTVASVPSNESLGTTSVLWPPENAPATSSG